MRRNDKPAFLVSISGIFAKVFHIIVTLYTMAIVINIFFIQNIYKACSTSGIHGLIETLNPVYIAVYFVGLFVLNKIYFLLYKISKRLRGIFEAIAPNYNLFVEEWNHENDHLHILFKAHPNSKLSKFINAYKSASSRLIKKEFPDVRKQLWKEMFWSRSFCLLTTGGVTIDIIKQYIESQGK